MAYIGVERAVEDALLGDLAGQDHPLGAATIEQIRHRRRIERAVVNLGDHAAVMRRHDRLSQIQPCAVARRVDDIGDWAVKSPKLSLT